MKLSRLLAKPQHPVRQSLYVPLARFCCRMPHASFRYSLSRLHFGCILGARLPARGCILGANGVHMTFAPPPKGAFWVQIGCTALERAEVANVSFPTANFPHWRRRAFILPGAVDISMDRAAPAGECSERSTPNPLLLNAPLSAPGYRLRYHGFDTWCLGWLAKRQSSKSTIQSTSSPTC